MAAYSYVLDAFAALGVQVVGLSVDSAADSAGLRERLQVDVPLVGELAYPDSVDALGAYRNEDRQSHQATAFVLDADRTVQTRGIQRHQHRAADARRGAADPQLAGNQARFGLTEDHSSMGGMMPMPMVSSRSACR